MQRGRRTIKGGDEYKKLLEEELRERQLIDSKRRQIDKMTLS